MEMTLESRLSAAFKPSATKTPAFATSGPLQALPELHVAGLGDVSFPFRPTTLKKLAQLGKPAPYGKGEDTILDERVRRTLQLPAESCELSGSWKAELARIVTDAETDLGLAPGSLRPELYKLLVYQTGGFFLPHRDSEKTQGMVASLLIVLPSQHEGGTLRVTHDGRERLFDCSLTARAGKGAWMAFYADCEHEVLPVTEGTRIALAYNLVLKRGKKAPPPTAPSLDAPRTLEGALRNWSAHGSDGQTLVHVLEHQYSSQGLSFSTLKGADARMADDLLTVARTTGIEVALGLVKRKCLHSGEVSYGWSGSYRRRPRWGHGDTSSNDEGDFRSHEIIDDEISLVRLHAPSGAPATLRTIALCKDEDLFVGKRGVDDIKSLKATVSEATGNEGATMEKWYRSAALVVWRRTDTLALLNKSLSTTAALRAFTKAARLGKDNSESPTDSDALLSFVDSLGPMEAGYASNGRYEKPLRLSLALLGAVRAFPHPKFLHTAFQMEGWGAILTGREAPALLHCIEACTPEVVERILFPFLRDALSERFQEPQRLLVGMWRREASLPAFVRAELLTLTLSLPTLFKAWRADSWHRHQANETGLRLARRFFLLSALSKEAPVSDVMVDLLLEPENGFDLALHVAPALIKVLEHENSARSNLEGARQKVMALLEKASAVEPVPPQDARRNAAFNCACADCSALKVFLSDPAALTHELRANQSRRSHVERFIEAAPLDLDCRTIAVGSPHRLVVTKNRATFERLHKRYKLEKSLLHELKGK